MNHLSVSFVAPQAFVLVKTKARPNAETCSVKASISEAQKLHTFVSLIRNSQERLCKTLEAVDGSAKFSSDKWSSDLGSGLTRVLQDGHIFEKAGVNVSVVQGTLSAARAKALRNRGKHIEPGEPYHAAALSFVLHAQSPHVPTLRGDVRMFASTHSLSVGGGVDLTVFYVNRKQIRSFHRHWKTVCDAHDTGLYHKLKNQCDEYFYIPSRAEYRGVGGLFYDDLQLPLSSYIPFTCSMLNNFLPSYLPILQSNARLPISATQKRWQRIRRGRYLEFNLLYDRGVRFGLSGSAHSRTDSIMISAPPSVEWPYNYEAEYRSPEWEAVQLLRGEPIDWVNYDGKEVPG